MKNIACFLLLFGIWSLSIGHSFAGALPGDVNGNKQMDMNIFDAILSLQVLSLSWQYT
jgi:hypothetical protein